MSTTGLEVFDSIHKTNSGLKEIAQSLGPDRRASYHALRAVLQALRDRLTVDEAVHLGTSCQCSSAESNDGLHLAGKPDRVRSREELLQRINDRLHLASIGPEDAARAVFKVLVHHPCRARSAASCPSFRGYPRALQSAASAMLESAVLRVLARKEHPPAKKSLPALRTIFGGHKEPQQLSTWRGRRRPIMRSKADCS
jgi:uncharacterized protein (DUF2267 family)